jgi:large subunit ribosomal protein L24
MKLKKGDTVVVITGDHKGKQGKIVEVQPSQNRAIVEGVNMVKKHTRPNTKNPQGGITETAAPIHISNLMYMDGTKASRLGYAMEDGKKMRMVKKTNKTIK